MIEIISLVLNKNVGCILANSVIQTVDKLVVFDFADKETSQTHCFKIPVYKSYFLSSCCVRYYG